MRVKVLLLSCILAGILFAKNRVAVMEFKNNGSENLSHLSGGIPDMLTTTLANSSKISVVGQHRIRKIISEMNLGDACVVSPDTAAEIGKTAGVDLVIIGSYIDLGVTVRIDAKVVDVKTAQIVSGAAQSVKAACIEEVDVAVDTLAGELLIKLIGEVTSTVLKGDPSLKGKLEIVINDLNISGITIDGKMMEVDSNGVASMNVAHGKHPVQVFKGMFQPQKLYESTIFVRGGYIVKAKYEKKKINVYATNPLPEVKVVE